MFVLSAVCTALLWQSQQTPALVIALLSLIPLSTAALLYLFIGNFFAAHMLVIAGASMAASALR
jgi:hypothetical protein